MEQLMWLLLLKREVVKWVCVCVSCVKKITTFFYVHGYTNTSSRHTYN
jgi:hypothetical protein